MGAAKRTRSRAGGGEDDGGAGEPERRGRGVRRASSARPGSSSSAAASSSSSSSSSSSAAEAAAEAASKKPRAKRAKTESAAAPAARSTMQSRRLLANLGSMVSGRVLARPSKRVRTPYVADVQLLDGTDSVVQAHSPSLGCAGMVSPGRIVEMTEVAATSSTSSSSSSSAKKTPPRKTSHSVCLCHDAPRVGGLGGMQGPVVGALPALAENFVLKALEEGWFAEFAPGYTVTKQKKYGGSRVDFVLNYEGEGEKEEKNKQDAAKSDVTQGATSPRKTLIEVKNVVCADYLPGENPISTGMEGELEPRLASCLQDAQTGALLRAAVFPHGGTRKPKIKVLSSRAIKHVHELTQLHLSRRVGEENLDSAMIFVVNRSDCERFRPAHESCPLFARVLYEASLAGVRLLAYTVNWDLASGCAYLGHRIPVEFSAETKATPLDRVWLDQVLVYEAGPKPDSLGTKSSDKKHKKKHKKRSRRHD